MLLKEYKWCCLTSNSLLIEIIAEYLQIAFVDTNYWFSSNIIVLSASLRVN